MTSTGKSEKRKTIRDDVLSFLQAKAKVDPKVAELMKNMKTIITECNHKGYGRTYKVDGKPRCTKCGKVVV